MSVVCGVYKITSPSGKIYIGSAKDIYRRWIPYANLKCKQQVRLYASFIKYGWEKHTLEIIEICDNSIRLQKERYWGDFYKVLGKNGLNCMLPGYNEIPKVISKETILKMSKPRDITDEVRLSFGNGMRNKKHTEETIKILSEISKNMSQETRDKMSKTRKSKSKEYNQMLGNAHKKKVIDTVLNKIYSSVAEASLHVRYDKTYLSKMLKGTIKNKTNLIYYKEWLIKDTEKTQV